MFKRKPEYLIQARYGAATDVEEITDAVMDVATDVLWERRQEFKGGSSAGPLTDGTASTNVRFRGTAEDALYAALQWSLRVVDRLGVEIRELKVAGTDGFGMTASRDDLAEVNKGLQGVDEAARVEEILGG